MAVKIRLARHGAKGRPFYWLMAADVRSPRETGKEKLGTYDPFQSDPKKRLTFLEERIRYWISCGAQPTDRVAKLLGSAGVLPPYIHRETPKKSALGKKALERKKEASA